MPKPTDVKIVDTQLYFLPFEMRVPLKFGPETVTYGSTARVCMKVEGADGRTAMGWGETPLSVTWVWPGGLTYDERDVEIGDYVIPAGTRCGLMFAAANRDPRRWQDPYRFDVKRANVGHLGFGFGVHACVGRVLALLEAEALLGAVTQSITRIEPAGKPEPWITTVGHGPIRLPVRLGFS